MCVTKENVRERHMAQIDHSRSEWKPVVQNGARWNHSRRISPNVQWNVLEIVTGCDGRRTWSQHHPFLCCTLLWLVVFGYLAFLDANLVEGCLAVVGRLLFLVILSGAFDLR